MIRSRRFRIAVVIAGGVAGFAASATLWLPALLIAPADAGGADAAILLAGDDPREPGPDLVLSRYRAGAVRFVACASPPAYVGLYPADASCRQLGEMGIPADRRFIVHLPQTECDREMLAALLSVARDQGWHSLLFVVSPERSRWLRRIATRDFARAGIRASVTYAEQDRADLAHGWWRTHRKAQRLVTEALDDGLDLFYGRCR